MGSSFFQDVPVDETTGAQIEDLLAQANAAALAAQTAQTNAETAQASAEAALAAAQAALAAIPATAESPWKLSVRAATTANIDLTDGPASVDSVSLVSGDRVLVKDQTDPTQNGIYQYNGVDVALTRADDNDAANEFPNGTTVYVEEGFVNQRRFYTQTTTGTIAPTTAKQFADIISASGNIAALPRPYDITSFAEGDLNADEVVLRFTAVRSFTIPADFGGSIATLGTAPVAPLSFTINKNGAAIGSIAFAASATTGVFDAITDATDEAFSSGQVLTVVAPSGSGGAQNLAITILGQVLV